MNKRQKSSINNFRLDSKVLKIDELDVLEIQSKDLFNNYISKRIPVKIKGHLKDSTWQGSQWTNEYLSRCSGNDVVKVERISGSRFGKGNEEKMKFGSFLDSIEKGDHSFYITTQELKHDIDGRPAITSPPVDGLIGDFPWCPAITGNLVVNNINIWMGSTGKKTSTSSGLHHDYHDNLYIVLRGQKTITLINPIETENMYTNGNLSYIHPNGRINYVGQATRADGTDVHAGIALLASQTLENAQRKLEEVARAKVAHVGAHGTAQELDDAEEEVETALEALLDAEIAGNEDDAEDDDEDEDEDDDEEEDDNEPIESLINGSLKYELFPTSLSEEQSLQLRQNNANKTKRKGKDDTAAAPADDDDDDNNNNDNEKDKDPTATSAEPLNFSRVDLTLSPTELQQQFPLFVEACNRHPPITIDICAGDMLFLPAGWFHEVKSSGESPLGHMAFNYWFHPPDANDFDKPYSDDFWLNDWKSRGLDNDTSSRSSYA